MADKKTGTDIEQLSAEEQALIESSKAGIDKRDLIVPHLKLVQGTTKQVPKDTPLGYYLNALTSETYAPPVEFIVAAQRKGRFGMDDDDNMIASGFSPISPEGIPWVDHPLAEEQWKAKVNRGDIEWGSGPPVSTTYNFFGYVAGTDVPVRLSLMRAATPVAKKWLTMLQFLPAFWDSHFVLGSNLIEQGRNKYHKPTVEQGPKSSPEERQQAVTLAQAIAQDAFEAPEAHDPDREAAPEGEGAGLGV